MASVPNPSLDAGLAALKEGNYDVAIAHLEGVCEFELDEAIISRASVALVKAYRRRGDTQNAIALCQTLTQDLNPKVQQWATNTLPELRAESPPAANQTGFTPEEDTSANPTGFVPLNSPSSPTKPGTIKQRLTDSAKRLFTGDKSRQNPPGNQPPPQPSSQLPVAFTPPSAPSVFSASPRFRNLGRAEKWRPFKRPKLKRLGLIGIASAIAFAWVLRFWLEFLMATTNTILVKLPLLSPLQWLYRDPTQVLAILGIVTLIVSPWLMDWLLRQVYGLEPLSVSQLAARSSESAKTIQRFCRQRRLPLPTLGILPTQAPLAITYGNLPRTARIVVSEGLLTQLAEDEIATIYAAQLGHIVNRDFILSSLGTLILQFPYLLYLYVAQGGEQLAEWIRRKYPATQRVLPPLCLGISSIISSLGYATYWLLRLPLLWFSRIRIYYSDRVAIETTGNPNGLTRALLKIGLGMSDAIHQAGQTRPLWDSFDLILPVGYRQGLLLSSCSPHVPFERVLQWECTNPYRHWLIITAAHPLLGDRLHLCARYAYKWRLGTELDLPIPPPPIRDNKTRLSKLIASYKAFPLFQSVLLTGFVVGVALRVGFWLLGILSDWLSRWWITGFWRLIWLHNAGSFLEACILIAFSLSIILWINRYFPDIKPAAIRHQPSLEQMLADPNALPSTHQPVEFTGKLLGRRGLQNWLGVDLIIETDSGLVKLHYFSILGPLGNLLPLGTRPSDLVGESVTVMGWFRRGVTPWIDVEMLSTSDGKISRAHYPLWLVILAVVAAIWASYLIWTLPA